MEVQFDQQAVDFIIRPIRKNNDSSSSSNKSNKKQRHLQTSNVLRNALDDVNSVGILPDN